MAEKSSLDDYEWKRTVPIETKIKLKQKILQKDWSSYSSLWQRSSSTKEINVSQQNKEAKVCQHYKLKFKNANGIWKQAIISITDKKNKENTIGIDNQKIVCDQCAETFTAFKDIELHLPSHLDIDFDTSCLCFVCDQCAKTFTVIEDIELHLSTHLMFNFNTNSLNQDAGHKVTFSETGFQNEFKKSILCLKKDKEQSSLGVKSHLDIDFNTTCFVCDQCAKSFTVIEDIKLHLSTHLDIDLNTTSLNEETGHKLNFNKADFQNEFKRSISAVKKDKERSSGVQCGKKIFKCPDCFASFTRLTNLNEHSKIHNEAKTKNICPVCSASFSSTKKLRDHSRYHTREKTFMCEICSAKFLNPSKLKRHYVTHSGLKPFQCPECPAAFSQSSGLNSHLKIHAGEKSHKCYVCSSSFSRATHLKQHLRIHTGEKPYACEYCSASFKDASTLKRHKDRVHWRG